MSLLWCSIGCPSLEVLLAMASTRISFSSVVEKRYLELCALHPRSRCYSNRVAVWRRLHFHTPWEKDHRVFGCERERIHSQWEAPRSQCGGNIQPSHHSSVWERGGIRLPECEVDGAEEGGYKYMTGLELLLT